MSIITKIIASELDSNFVKIAAMEPEERFPWVGTAVQAYMDTNPVAFENVDVGSLTEQEIIDEIVPSVAAGLVVLEMLGEDASVALTAELREKTDLAMYEVDDNEAEFVADDEEE